jgi:hypothetical protein
VRSGFFAESGAAAAENPAESLRIRAWNGCGNRLRTLPWKLPAAWHFMLARNPGVELVMKRLLGFIGLTVGGWIGWWLGMFVGIGTAVVLSGILSGVGMYWAVKLGRDYLE